MRKHLLRIKCRGGGFEPFATDIGTNGPPSAAASCMECMIIACWDRRFDYSSVGVRSRSVFASAFRLPVLYRIRRVVIWKSATDEPLAFRGSFDR